MELAMDISGVFVNPPTQAELIRRTPEEKMWSEFDFFYENGEPHYFELENGTKITFGNNPKQSGWDLMVDHNLVLTSSDANQIVTKALEFSK